MAKPVSIARHIHSAHLQKHMASNQANTLKAEKITFSGLGLIICIIFAWVRTCLIHL